MYSDVCLRLLVQAVISESRCDTVDELRHSDLVETLYTDMTDLREILFNKFDWVNTDISYVTTM